MDNWITLLYIWNKWLTILQYKIKVKLKKKKKTQKQQTNAHPTEGTAQYSWGDVKSWWPGLVSSLEAGQPWASRLDHPGAEEAGEEVTAG